MAPRYAIVAGSALVVLIWTAMPVVHSRAYDSECRPLPSWPVGRPVFEGRELMRFDVREKWNPADVDPERSLLIRHLSVVNDRDRTWDPAAGVVAAGSKPWSFGRLLEAVATATKVDAAMMARQWVDHWTRATSAHDLSIGPEPTLIQALRRAWGMSEAGVDVSVAPFRLLAIVNRVDLAKTDADGGELRFVYGAVTGAPNQPPDPFVVIVELAPRGPRSGWATRWKALANHPLGTAKFNDALSALTDDVLKSALGRSSGGDSSAIRLRTAKQIAGLQAWEYREFVAEHGRGLVLTTTKQTPTESYRDEPGLGQWLAKRRATVLSLQHTIPARFSEDGLTGPPFLGIAADLRDPGRPWVIGQADSLLRHRFALDTCNGCHGHETLPWDAAPFHVKPRRYDECAELSTFLTGEVRVTDPIETFRSRQFADLLRRQSILADLAPVDRYRGRRPPLSRGAVPSVH
jgi:hypothetical protein